MRWIKTLSPIGLDIGARSVKAIQLSQGLRQTNVVASTVLPRHEPDTPITQQEAQSLINALPRQGFVGSNIVLAAPHDAILTAMIELPPPTPGLPVERVAQVEFARINHLESNAFEMAYWPLPNGPRSNDNQAFAVGCLHEHANPYIDLFQNAGANVHALETTSNAIARAIQPLIAHTNDITAIIDIGWTGAQIIVLHQDTPIYSRLLTDMGLLGVHTLLRRRGDFDADVADWLIDSIGLNTTTTNTDDSEPQTQQHANAVEVGAILAIYAENLAIQAGAAINYVEHRYPEANVASLFVSGGGADIPGLTEHLRQSLNITVNTAAPHQLANVDSNTHQDTLTPLMLGAFGLATYKDSSP